MRSTNLFSRRLALAAVLGGLCVVAAGREVQAGFTVQLEGSPVAGPGSNFTYNYTASTTADDALTAGDFFRIYDFAGLVGTPTAPAGWTAAVSNSNPTPPPNIILTHGDDPGTPNLVFTYTGATQPGPLLITGFTAVSNFSSTTSKDFVGRVTKLDGGTPIDSTGAVTVPNAVPEPASLISGSIGVIIFGVFYACRHRRMLQASI